MIDLRARRKAAIEHIVSEYTSLLSAGHYAIYGAAPWRSHAARAFLLHYRNVDRFLLSAASPEEIRAADFVESGEDLAWDLPTWRTEWREIVDDRLDSLTYRRLEERPWTPHEWVSRLDSEARTAWAQFYAQVTDAEYRREFAHQTELRRRELVPFHVRVELLYV